MRTRSEDRNGIEQSRMRGTGTIAENLMAPETAAGQVSRILNVADELTEMPFRFSLYEFEPWHSQGLRFVPVDNYILFYQPKEEANTVYIVRIMYGGRDIRKQFEENLNGIGT